MTGTSCDAADLALLQLKIKTKSIEERLVATETRNFPVALRTRLREAQQGKITAPKAALLGRDYSRWVAQFCKERLGSWNMLEKPLVIAIHGQTIWHDPQNFISLQIVDPTILSYETGCTVTSFFRQPDLARRGQGAPLVPYYHWLRANSSQRYRKLLPFAIHNVGGIANLTYITGASEQLIAFDTGPGNALIDLAVEQLTGGSKKFDHSGKIAAGVLGSIRWDDIRKLGRHRYFVEKPPKSTGRELFNEDFLRKLPGKGAVRVAHATAFSAHTMAAAYHRFVLHGNNRLQKILIAGGGSRNPVLMQLFRQELERMTGRNIPVEPLADDFAPAQYLEAMAFARLGLNALTGKPVSLAQVTGAAEDGSGAGIFPGKNFKRLLDAARLL
ncbi:MAG: anhydro-N-acetylmuramic acid kinase [Bdellovibrionota bacterium]